MKHSNWLIVAVAAAVLSAASILNSNAAESDSGLRPARQKWLQVAREELELTQEQEQRIKATLREHKDTLKELIAALHQARSQLRQAIQSPDANESAVRSAATKVAAVEADLAVERMKLYAQINPVLSGEQLQKLKELRSRFEGSMERAIERLGKGLNSK